MTPLENFLMVNNLKQVELADFLHVNKSTISSAASGKTKLARTTLGKILANDKGWDTSMLEEHEKVTYTAHSESGDAFFGSKVVKGPDVAAKLQIKALIDQIDILKEQLRTQEQQYEQRLAEERARTQREKDLVDSLMKMMNK